ncbi:MAG: metal-sulfur cluster assembly factor [Chloroflexi bacterium]|uniref:Metal-sulfur cluster assembly factor n=1 Tax=Candidatus Chlorohelix allophototropha TaxID=3003348 RepID=A0A8T7MA61_9CHLR|nr:metal-sulfur cluster assembly factor [Chloroflexota bacterium]WJW68862.1 metal-sulfur cluster assembly factor [Chloroflexota bacterium L227-S17]
MSLPTEEELKEALKTVYDPEIGINIVDLGLIYGVDIDDEGLVDITMTLTSPGCPLGHVIGAQVREALDGMPGVNDVKLNLVWSPSWNPTMMTEDAKEELGIDGTY